MAEDKQFKKEEFIKFLYEQNVEIKEFVMSCTKIDRIGNYL